MTIETLYNIHDVVTFNFIGGGLLTGVVRAIIPTVDHNNTITVRYEVLVNDPKYMGRLIPKETDIMCVCSRNMVDK